MNNKIIVGMIVGVILVGVASFFGGIKYAAAGRTRVFAGTQGAGQRFTGAVGAVGGNRGAGGAGAAGGTARMGFVTGQVVSKDATSLTVKLQNGGSQIIFLGTSTPVMKSETGSLDDVQVGTEISANGTPNQDGSISARSIQIGTFGGGFRQTNINP